MTLEQRALLHLVAAGLGLRTPNLRPAGDVDLSSVDWDTVIYLARLHGVLGLLGAGMEAPDAVARRRRATQVPRAVIERVTELRDAEVQRSVYLSCELLRVLQLLQDGGVEVLAFKGPLLAHRVYGGIGRRSFWDLDLLIPKEAFARARAILERDGYQPEELWSARRERRELRRNCEYNLDHPDRGVHLELHWRFVPSYLGFARSSREMAGFWARSETVLFMGHRVPVLRLSDELSALAVHNAVKHAWERLRMVADIAAFVVLLTSQQTGGSAPGGNAAACSQSCAEIMARAEALGARRAPAVGLLLAERLLGAPVPEALRAWARADRRAEPLAERFAEDLFSFNGVEVVDNLRRARSVLALRERRRDRVRHFLRLVRIAVLPSDRERELLPLPKPLRWVQVAVRPFRLARKYLLRYLARLRGRTGRA